MKELSLNILDIAMNSVKAGAHKISIIIDENEKDAFNNYFGRRLRYD